MTPWTTHFNFLGLQFNTHEDGGYILSFRLRRFEWMIGIQPDFK